MTSAKFCAAVLEVLFRVSVKFSRLYICCFFDVLYPGAMQRRRNAAAFTEIVSTRWKFPDANTEIMLVVSSRFSSEEWLSNIQIHFEQHLHGGDSICMLINFTCCVLILLRALRYFDYSALIVLFSGSLTWQSNRGSVLCARGPRESNWCSVRQCQYVSQAASIAFWINWSLLNLSSYIDTERNVFLHN